MSRKVELSFLDHGSLAVPVENGGTGTQKVGEIANNIGVVPLSQKNVANGVAGLDSNSKVLPSQLPILLAANTVNVTGNFVLVANNTYIFTITDYDSFKSYTVSCSNGVMTRVEDILTYVANGVLGPHTFTVNGRIFDFVIQLPGPLKPTLTSPVNNAVVGTTSYTFTGNAFVEYGDNATHLNSDWQLATDVNFSTIVRSTSADTTNKVSWPVTGLSNNTTYFAHVRYRASNGNVSAWSDTVRFSITSPTPGKPNIQNPTNNQSSVPVNTTMNSDTFGSLSDGSTHISSDWQLSTNANFTVISAQIVDSTANKTAWPVTLTDSSTYYVRTRQKASNGNISPWSDTVTFNTVFVDHSTLVLNLTISSNQPSGVNTNSLAYANGWDGVRAVDMTVNISAGVYVSSFQHAGGWPAGSSFRLNNNGYIIGEGGQGGTGGNIYRYNTDYNVFSVGNGATGRTALEVGYAITINNTNLIAGGGGGGGGGNFGNYTKISTPPTANFGQTGGSGGGGQGYPAGGNNGLYNPGSYNPATTNQPGQGLDGSALSDAYGTASIGYKGGDGGTFGSPGTAGIGGTPGGAAGYAVTGNSFITWLSTGSRVGPII